MSISRLISPTFRVVIGLVALTISIILMASFFGIFPDHRSEITRGRRQLCETMAIGFSALASKVDINAMQDHFESIVDRNPDVRSVGLKLLSGEPVLEVGDHFANSDNLTGNHSSETAIVIPIFEAEGQWGNLEVRFQDITDARFGWIRGRPELVLAAFVGMVGLVVYFVYLSYVLKQLEPSRAIPARVREALDTLAEGLIVMDTSERIVLANKAILTATGFQLSEVLGKKVDTKLSFETATQTEQEFGLPNELQSTRPWKTAMDTGTQVRGVLLQLRVGQQATTYSVSCSPIRDPKGKPRGVLMSMEDVTVLENKNNELKDMVVRLDASSEEIRKQNRELEILATRDALTGCVNRRSFFSYYDKVFADSLQFKTPLSVMMVDIDHFKLINDNHGHSVGDKVLQEVATCLQNNCREQDMVCRYGGEEFSILLPNTSMDVAAEVAEGLRKSLEQLQLDQVAITTSVGVSDMTQSPESPLDMLEQADDCLYVAKRNGRNQVVRHDNIPDDIECGEAANSRTSPSEQEMRIPFHAVTALISALAYRDQVTANHSRRVADLCVAVAEGLLPMRECYTLEIAGLLHDIGKIGVPDSILMKPERLTPEEHKVMKLNQKLGAELVRVSFGCRELDDILEHYKSPYHESGTGLPIGARILAIVDAFDSMVADKTYRKGMSTAEAIKEIKRCAGEQFDPELVVRVVRTLQTRGDELFVDKVSTSKAAALSIGVQIEQLYTALDSRDINRIQAIASRLEDSANQHGAAQIADKANTISESSSDDFYDVLQNTNELLDLCRLSQRALLTTSLEEAN